jgi:8-oxo-dGTP diphosphatase
VAKGAKGQRDEERAFLAAYDPAAFDRPSLAVDVALLTVIDGHLEVALVERTQHPHQGRWALPGGFVRMDESLEKAATRVLREKAGLADMYLEQLYTFGEPERDPRTRVVSVAYYALVDHARLASTGRANLTFGRIVVPWEGEAGGPVEARDRQGRDMRLAFDHADILGMAVKRIRGKLDYTPIGFQLLPETFTLRRLQDVHETILGRTLNKDSFRRRMLGSRLLEATGERETEVGHRPAELYRFTRGSAI